MISAGKMNDDFSTIYPLGAKLGPPPFTNQRLPFLLPPIDGSAPWLVPLLLAGLANKAPSKWPQTTSIVLPFYSFYAKSNLLNLMT